MLISSAVGSLHLQNLDSIYVNVIYHSFAWKLHNIKSSVLVRLMVGHARWVLSSNDGLKRIMEMVLLSNECLDFFQGSPLSLWYHLRNKYDSQTRNDRIDEEYS
ncbi:hypothetical protein SLE2022_083030 [Rubroshorea leprosula]